MESFSLLLVYSSREDVDYGVNTALMLASPVRTHAFRVVGMLKPVQRLLLK